MTMVVQSARLEQVRRDLPSAVGKLAELAIDNPRPLILTFAGTIVTTRILINAVRPRTAVEALALMIVAPALCGWAAGELARRGFLEFRVRDVDGNLTPMRWAVGDDDPGSRG